LPLKGVSPLFLRVWTSLEAVVVPSLPFIRGSRNYYKEIGRPVFLEKRAICGDF